MVQSLEHGTCVCANTCTEPAAVVLVTSEGVEKQVLDYPWLHAALANHLLLRALVDLFKSPLTTPIGDYVAGALLGSLLPRWLGALSRSIAI